MKLVRALRFASVLVLVASTTACVGGAAKLEAGDSSTGAGGTGGANGTSEGTGTFDQGGGGGGPTGTPVAGESGSQAGGNEGLAETSPDGKSTLNECVSGLPSTTFFLSADDSNSMASPVIAREMLLKGIEPDPAQVRTHEFLNYYNAIYPLDDPQAKALGVFTEMTEMGASPDTGLPRFRLQIGVQAFQVPRVPLVLTFVVDTSGSLVGPGIERERAAILAVVHQLQLGDIVNIVTWANDQNVLLEHYVAKGTLADDAAIATAVNKLAPGGGSDLHAGLVKGYKLADQYFDETKLNRLVLISDGGANVGVIDRTIISDAAARANNEGIYLVGIGVGPAEGYSDALMDLVTDKGRGAYVYLDGPEEAEVVFQERFDEVMNVAARNVQVQLELPEYMQIEEFYGEEYSEDVAQIEPQHLAPGDSMVFNEVVYVADPKVACAFDTVGVTVRWETPITHDAREIPTQKTTFAEMLAKPPSHQMLKANAVIAYAEALKTGLKDDIAAALDTVKTAASTTGDPDLAKIAALLELHPTLHP